MGTESVRGAVPKQTELPEFPDEIKATFIAEGTTRNWVKVGLLTSNVGDELMESQVVYLGKRLIKAWGEQAFEVTIKPIHKR